MVKSVPAGQETWVRSLGQEDLLEMGMVTPSSVLGWKTPWTEEPGGLQSKESGATERLILGGEGTRPQSHPPLLPGGYFSGEHAGKLMESAILALCAQVSCDPFCPYATYM